MITTLAKYNQSKTITFDLVAPDGVDLITNATFAAGDIVIMKDEGAEANTTNLPTDEGTGYSLVLTATEMSAARVRLYIIDQTGTKVWLDVSIGIETYGNASAEHAFDLDTASTAQTGDNYARLGAPAGASISADISTVDTVVDGIQTDLNNGTDGLGAIKADTAAILVDTADLQANQGNWVTATGFATAANLSTMQTDVDAILIDTGELQTNQGDWLTATSFATEAKQDLMQTDVSAILVDTAEIGTAGAGLTNINLPNQTMDITGNLSGSVGSVTGGATSAAQTTAQNDLNIITGADGVNLLSGTQASIDAIEADTDVSIPALIAALNNISAAQVNAECDTAISDAALATAAALATVDTVADAIKVITDQFVFTIANQVDSNIQSINDVSITGDGSGTPFDV